jgi:hypothetical protein
MQERLKSSLLPKVERKVEEHETVLKLMLSQPKACNTSESSEEWRDFYQQMCKEYCIPTGNNPRFMLHGQLVEMYSAFTKAVRNLSLLSGAPKFPASYGIATND